jgi:acyl-coenzyme A synthetase/AMP-(fatty) acid ligase
MALCATLKPVTNHYIYAEWMGGVCQRVSVPLNNRLKSAELTQLLERLQPTLYIGHADLYSGPRAVESSILPPESRFVVRGTREDSRMQPWTNLIRDASASAAVRTDLHSPAVLLATSGTTGVPKFFIHTGATLAAAIDLWEQFELHEDQTTIVAFPIVHGGGLFTFFGCLRFGVPDVSASTSWTWTYCPSPSTPSRAVRAGLVTTFYTYPEPRPIRVDNPASHPSRRAVAGLMQIKVTAPALSRALSRLAAAPYDACEKRAGRVNGLAFTDLWE